MAKPQINPIYSQLGNPSVPLKQRAEQLVDIMEGARKGDSAYQPIANDILDRIVNSTLDELAKERADALGEILKQLESAPMRPATFIELSKAGKWERPHALVALDNGDFGFVVVHDQASAKDLRLGDKIVIDGQGKILLTEIQHEFYQGEEVRLERRIDKRHIEVVDTQDRRSVVLANHNLLKEIESGQALPGCSIILCSGGQVGLKAVPLEKDELKHFHYLDRGGIPNIITERDIGSPSPVIGEIAQHIREEMTRPELRRKFRLRPCRTFLFAGVSGSGKTLTYQAIHRQMYEIMSEVTGTPIGELPNRVIRFRTDQILSMWLGESDKNAYKIFDETEQLARVRHKNAKGEEFVLPVLVIMEEAEGMGRSRGQDHDGVYDRILTTLLQRLDPNRAGLADQLIVFISTTNEPHLVDAAFLRRIGGTVVNFGRLDQRAFADVLRKHVDGLPAADGNGLSQKKCWANITGIVQNWLYNAEGDQGVVELNCSGIEKPVVRYARHFLTGALVDRAVQEAATQAWSESLKNPEAGVTSEQLAGAIRRQVMAVVQQLTPQNIGHYTDIPDGVRVNGVKIIKSPSK